MPLIYGRYRGYDFDRMVAKFTMLDGDRTVNFEVSTAYMDDLERNYEVRAHERDAQFERLRPRIELAASREYYARGGNSDQTILLQVNPT